jgi:hypothetical protein
LSEIVSARMNMHGRYRFVARPVERQMSRDRNLPCGVYDGNMQTRND